jgi:TetR/AcrR family transcriptional regulator, cholesterol catabolism regulator
MDYLRLRTSQIRSSISGGREGFIEESRDRIVEAATKLFRRNGFHKTVIKDIAQELGVSQGHIYQYISKKEDILVLILDRAVQDYKEKLFEIPLADGSPADRVRAAIRSYYLILDEHHEKTNVLYNQVSNLHPNDRKIFDQVEREVLELFQNLIEKGVEEGIFGQAEPYLLAFNIVSLGHMWALKRGRFRGRMDVERYIELQTGYVLGMLEVRRPGE